MNINICSLRLFLCSFVSRGCQIYVRQGKKKLANKLHYSLRIVIQFTIQKQQGHKRVPGKLNPARDNSTLFSNNYFIRKTFKALLLKYPWQK